MTYTEWNLLRLMIHSSSENRRFTHERDLNWQVERIVVLALSCTGLGFQRDAEDDASRLPPSGRSAVRAVDVYSSDIERTKSGLRELSFDLAERVRIIRRKKLEE